MDDYFDYLKSLIKQLKTGEVVSPVIWLNAFISITIVVICSFVIAFAYVWMLLNAALTGFGFVDTMADYHFWLFKVTLPALIIRTVVQFSVVALFSNKK